MHVIKCMFVLTKAKDIWFNQQNNKYNAKVTQSRK